MLSELQDSSRRSELSPLEQELLVQLLRVRKLLAERVKAHLLRPEQVLSEPDDEDAEDDDAAGHSDQRSCSASLLPQMAASAYDV